MSRIGKQPISIIKGVDVSLAGHQITVKGPKGTLKREIPDSFLVEISAESIHVKMAKETPEVSKEISSKWGLYRVLIDNMVCGVANGYTKDLEIVGVGYKAELKGKDLVVSVGYSHPVTVKSPAGITITTEGLTKVKVSGCDKELVGQVAADIRSIKKPEPYKGKGIRYAGEAVRKKAGKTAGK